MHISSLAVVRSTATTRTLRVWFVSNVGGTGWLVLNFCRNSPVDIGTP